jgi:hypothetical protein
MTAVNRRKKPKQEEKGKFAGQNRKKKENSSLYTNQKKILIN